MPPITQKLLVSQVSPGPGDDNAVEDKDDDEVAGVDRATSESANRSSSFLFDSLYDTSLLADLSPCHTLDQSEEDEAVDQEMGDKCPLRSTQERRRSELLANQEAEQQEAIQWGESSFNLSEWGDSLLVGEHFLERRSLLRHTERIQREQGASPHRQHNAGHALAEEQTAESAHPEPSRIQPPPTTATTTRTQTKHAKDKTSNSQIKQQNNLRNDNKPGGGQEKKMKGTSASSSDNPHVQNAPESTFYCSPGLQEIFDRWPSMSDQQWLNTAASRAPDMAGIPDPPQPSIHVARRGGNVQIAASDSGEEQPLRHNSEDATERPGSAGDLIPPTQETPPVTPRVRLTTSSVPSPLTAQPLNQSTPSNPQLREPAVSKCSKSLLGRSDVVTKTGQPNSTPDCSHKQQKPTPLPVVPKTKTLLSDPNSPVIDEGFTLQLSQDASLCSSNSGTFTIIDVASDRRLFEMFISEWKTKERYSLALACEKREHRQQPEGEIGGKHKRGKHAAGEMGQGLSWILIRVHVFCAASAAHQKLQRVDGFPVSDSDGKVLIGLAVCWGARDAYYLSLQQEQGKGEKTDVFTCIWPHKLSPNSVFSASPCPSPYRFERQSGPSPAG